MAAANPSWQDVLESLTEKARKDGLLRSLKNAKTVGAKVDKVIDSISIRYGKDMKNFAWPNDARTFSLLQFRYCLLKMTRVTDTVVV